MSATPPNTCGRRTFLRPYVKSANPIAEVRSERKREFADRSTEVQGIATTADEIDAPSIPRMDP